MFFLSGTAQEMKFSIKDFFSKCNQIRRKLRICSHLLKIYLTENFISCTVWVFFHDYSQFTGLQGKGEAISLTPHYHFHLLHRNLDISRAVTAESSPLHITSSRTRTGNLWFPSATR